MNVNLYWSDKIVFVEITIKINKPCKNCVSRKQLHEVMLTYRMSSLSKKLSIILYIIRYILIFYIKYILYSSEVFFILAAPLINLFFCACAYLTCLHNASWLVWCLWPLCAVSKVWTYKCEKDFRATEYDGNMRVTFFVLVELFFNCGVEREKPTLVYFLVCVCYE